MAVLGGFVVDGPRTFRCRYSCRDLPRPVSSIPSDQPLTGHIQEAYMTVSPITASSKHPFASDEGQRHPISSHPCGSDLRQASPAAASTSQHPHHPRSMSVDFLHSSPELSALGTETSQNKRPPAPSDRDRGCGRAQEASIRGLDWDVFRQGWAGELVTTTRMVESSS